MQKITRKKLALPRETVRQLSNTLLLEVVGADHIVPSVPDTNCVKCPTAPSLFCTGLC